MLRGVFLWANGNPTNISPKQAKTIVTIAEKAMDILKDFQAQQDEWQRKIKEEKARRQEKQRLLEKEKGCCTLL